ncbi:FAD-dependent oxidoreductase [Sphingobium phenoxybenzoativorans]|uniref:Tryptophan 2-monooxygenase n=1 Tax=Sphingobium phenoxybenzoativorans TaxID=1592790 RepID=A0A975K4W8_9SPHN|nr:FAD-dependent oxidoreductase [Sphingobium phenoxybenzoativorans]QUT04883.1 FAD-dependent oxidoreductase [Sphingobium phenoxybenzoativorans]
MSITRRDFLNQVAIAGGYAATFSAMQALGMIPRAEASTLPSMPADFGKGRKVVIAGGGIAGLTAAYELRKAGFEPVVLEAAKRPGGRNWTARKGTTVEFIDGTKQECSWDEGHYFNMGPARLPSIHKHVLGYCSELGVELEVEINTSRSALMQSAAMNGGKPVEQRRVMHDTRGHLAELLAKAIDQHTLDDLMTPEELKKLRYLVKGFGDLDADMKYKGTERGGYAVARGAGPVQQKFHTPIPLSELLEADMTKGEFYEEHIDWQATMFQPVGGMDRIPYAFAASLGDIVRYESPVSEIRNTARGVEVTCTQSGKPVKLHADFCICTMPAPILKSVKGLSRQTIAAATAIKANALYKVAWEAPRFWEKENNIYGGISFLKEMVDLVWYPSAKLFSDKGVIVAGFNLEREDDGSLTPFGKLDMSGKLAESRRSVEILHPGHGGDLTKPIYINWAQIPYQLGCVGQTDLPDAQAAYAQLNEPDGRVWFAADWLSRLTGWQEGAILSAHRAIAGIAGHVKGTAAAA